MLSLTEWMSSCRNVLVVGIGGGGDAISAFPTINHLQNLGKNVILANVHVSSNPKRFSENSQYKFGNAAFLLNAPPSGEKYARCIELSVISLLNIPSYSCLSNYGSKELSESFEMIMELNQIDSVIAIDGGTDSFAGLDTNITSIINDAISLAALRRLRVTCIPLGVIGCCADLEMDLFQFMQKFSYSIHKQSYMGVIDFPINLLEKYQSLIIEARKWYTFFVSESISRAASGEYGDFINCYDQVIPVNPFQMFSFFFDSKFVSEELNPFVNIVADSKNFESAKILIEEYLNTYRPDINWSQRLKE